MITFEGVQYSKWWNPVRFSDITKVIHHTGTLASLRLVATFAKYYRRHLAMKQYVSEKRERPAPALGGEDRELVGDAVRG